MSRKTGWEPNISSFGSIISHLIIRPLRLLYHPYLSLLFFLVEPPTQSRTAFPSPPLRSIISHLIIRPLRLLYHPYLSLLSFGRAPYAEPYGFPPPLSTFAFDYFASNHTTTTLALPSLPISAFFFGRAPPTQSRAAFPSPPLSTFAFDYFASNHTTTTLALPSLPISAFFW